jgi:hypothetical protein
MSGGGGSGGLPEREEGSQAGYGSSHGSEQEQQEQAQHLTGQSRKEEEGADEFREDQQAHQDRGQSGIEFEED